MKNPYSIYSRQWLGLDYKVIISFIVTLFIALVLFGFKLATHVTCSPVTITTMGEIKTAQNNSFNINEKIQFQASMSHAQQVEWDFGDGSKKVTGAKIQHRYLVAGKYFVNVVINKKCKETFMVLVKDLKSAEISNTEPEASAIIGPDVITAGLPTSFTTAQQAGSYEWYIQEDAAFGKKTNNTISYTPSNTGTVTLVLVLDKDSTKIWRKPITINPPGAATTVPEKTTVPKLEPLPPIYTPPPRDPGTKPEDTKPVDPSGPAKPPVVAPPVKKFVRVPDQEMQRLLNELVDKKIGVADFDNYLCKGGDTQVKIDGEWSTFKELVAKAQKKKKGLLGSKKAKVKLVRQTPNPDMDNKCLIFMEVTVDY